MFAKQTTSRIAAKLTLCVGVLAGSSIGLADLPKVLDLVPSDTPIVISVRNVGEFKDHIEGMMRKMMLPTEAFAGLGEMEAAITLAGVNRNGSLAMLVYPPKVEPHDEGGLEEGEEHEPVILLPVNDYAAFVTAGGGDPKADTTMVTFEDFSASVRRAGDGFVAMCEDADDFALYTPTTAQKAGHEKTLGTVGMRIADTSDAFVYANMATLRPMLEAGLAEGRQSIKELAADPGMSEMPGGGDMGEMMGSLMDVGETIVRDAQAAVFGLKLTDGAGVMDLGVQFTSGTESAGSFNSTGNSSSLLGMLPNEPFVAAYSMDMRDANLKRAMTKYLEFSQKMQGGMSGFTMGFGPEIIALADGQAAILGTIDLSAGLFSKMSQIVTSKNPQGLRTAYTNIVNTMDGTTQQGMTFHTTFSPEAKEIAGRKVDVWTMAMDVDPESEMAMAMQMVGPMLFGPEGQMKGYAATIKDGLAFTMSPNTPLLTATIEAAEGGPGLGLNADVARVAEMLPAGRTMEMYLGTREITQSIHDAMMAFMGEAPFEVPEKLSPIGFGATTNDGGLHLRIVMPSDVLAFMSEMTQKYEGPAMEDEMNAEPAEPAGAPRF